MISRFKVTLLAGFFLPLLVISAMVMFSSVNSPGKGGFSRNYIIDHLILIKKRLIKEENYYIAGVLGEKIFLASSVDIHKMLVVNCPQADTQYLTMNTHALGIAHLGVDTKIDSPFVFQIEPITPSVLRGDLMSLQFSKLKLPVKNFESVLPISASTFIAKIYDTRLKQDILCKISLDSAFNNKYVMEKQLDGRFSVDGMLIGNSRTNQFFYIYYYRNEFIKLDSNLQVQYAKNTIDTVRFARIKVSEIVSDRSLNLSVPPPFVNKRACIGDEHLFILSGISSDNEELSARQASVVDVYNLQNGTYIKSFYIPHIDGFECGSFKVRDHKLIATYKHAIAIYAINNL